jgi:hypothetical protein
LVQSRKAIRTDTKVAIDELEEALAKAHAKCMEDHGANVRAEKAKGGGGTSKRKSAKSRRKKQSVEDDDDEEEEDDENVRKSSFLNYSYLQFIGIAHLGGQGDG